MPNITTPTELANALQEIFGDILLPTHKRGPAPAPAKKGEAAAVDLLATDDVVIQPERLIEVALYIRDTLGYELLTNLTATDYLHDGIIELIYHFIDVTGGPLLTLKTRVPRENPVVPSLTPVWPGANFQEREAFDLFGVAFSGHPNLRRIYMWEEFEGFPMRKDFPKQGDKYIGETGEGE